MKFIFAFLMVVLAANAATHTASSTSLTDVRAAYDLCSDGDKLAVPAGTSTWTDRFEVAKAITIEGAGIGQTIIRRNVPSAFPKNAILIDVTLVPAKNTRITGFEFNDAPGAEQGAQGVIRLSGNSFVDGSRVRLDHCKFDQLWNLASILASGVLGVADHCIASLSSTTYFCYVYHASWNGGDYGDSSWADGVRWGSDEFWYMEDNTVSNTSLGYFICDSYRGARWVSRYNTGTNVGHEAHGTESGGRHRSTRAVEIYNNTLSGSGTPPFSLLGLRGGSAVVFGNTCTGFASSSAVHGLVYRAFANFFFQVADGRIAWDTNDAGRPFSTGTSTSATATDQSSGTITDSTKTWTTNQWVGYTVRNNVTGRASYITSNTSTTLTFMGSGGFSGFLAFNLGGGEAYEINKPLELMDQPGTGNCNLLSGDNPTPVNLFQVDEPAYVWNNSYNGGAGDFTTEYPTIRAGEHYVNGPKPGYTPFTYPYPWPSDNQVAAPVFSPPSGTFSSAQSVTITSSTSGANIRYTTNGTDPSPSVGTVYSAPVSISVNTTLKAIAYNGVLTDSTITSGSYLFASAGDGNVIGTTTVTTQITLP